MRARKEELFEKRISNSGKIAVSFELFGNRGRPHRRRNAEACALDSFEMQRRARVRKSGKFDIFNFESSTMQIRATIGEQVAILVQVGARYSFENVLREL